MARGIPRSCWSTLCAHGARPRGDRFVTRATKLKLVASLVDALGIMPGCTGDQAAAQAAAEGVLDEALLELIGELQRQLRTRPFAETQQSPARLRLVAAR